MAEEPTSDWVPRDTNQGKVFFSVSQPRKMREPEARKQLLVAHHDKDGINRLEAISALLSHLPPLLDHSVEVAWRQGRSWAEIGEALGVSPQAAHSKFADRLNLR